MPKYRLHYTRFGGQRVREDFKTKQAAEQAAKGLRRIPGSKPRITTVPTARERLKPHTKPRKSTSVWDMFR